VPDQTMIPLERCVSDVRLMARRLALLYYYFATTLVDELGDARAQRLIAEAIARYGEHCGRAVREGVEALGLPPTAENYGTVADLPSVGWEFATVHDKDGHESRVCTFCPLADVFQELGASELGRLYCHVDQAKYRAYNPDYEFIHRRNVLDGDDYCEFEVRKRADAPPPQDARSQT